jgi:hypothetical protein
MIGFTSSLANSAGFHASLDLRCAIPRPLNAYFSALYPQDCINEIVTFFGADGKVAQEFNAGHPPAYEPMAPRDSYDTTDPVTFSDQPHISMRLGDIVLARSGDKGANLNFGVFVQTEAQWQWLRSFMSRATMRTLLGDDARDDYFIERVEFPHLFAVHFVIYGILGKGVSSSSRLDGFGKGFADFVRDIVVDVPKAIL